MAVFKHPRVHVPGKKFDFQLPKVSDNRIFDDIELIKSSTIVNTQVSVSGAVAGDFLIWSNGAGAFVPEDFTTYPFGFGKAPVTTEQLLVSPTTTSSYGLVVTSAVGQVANLLEVRDASAGVLLSVSPTGDLTASGNLTIKGNGEILGSLTLPNSLTAGSATLNSLTVTGSTVLQSSAAISGGLSVAGATNFLSTVDCLSSLAVTGGVTIRGVTNLLNTSLFSKLLTANQGITVANSGATNLILTTQSTTDLDDVPQLALQAGYSIPENRSINIQQIRNGVAGLIKNYLLTGGALGTGSTASVPVLTSSFGNAFGVEGTDTSLSLISAPVGSNQPITRGLQMDVSGSVTLGSQLTVTSSASMLSTASVTGVVTVTANSGGRCLTLNSDRLAATIWITPASGTQRCNLHLPTYQILTDSTLSSTNDLIFQNLNTGRSPLQLGADDTVTLGTSSTSVTVSGAVTALKSVTLQSTLAHQGSSAGFFGTSPTSQPVVSGSLNGNPALRSLVGGLSTLGLVTNNTGSTDPTTTSFSWVNQGTATVGTGNGTLYLNSPASSGDALRLQVVSAPTGSYTVTLGYVPNLVYSNFMLCGLALRNASSGAIVTLALTSNAALDSTGQVISVSKWNSATSFNANYTPSPSPVKAAPWQAGACMWLRIQDDGANRICSVSNDGINFFEIHSTSNTDFIKPDQIGFFADSNSSLYGGGINVVSWQLTTP